jgi:hypothetical protein
MPPMQNQTSESGSDRVGSRGDLSDAARQWPRVPADAFVRQRTVNHRGSQGLVAVTRPRATASEDCRSSPRPWPVNRLPRFQDRRLAFELLCQRQQRSLDAHTLADGAATTFSGFDSQRCWRFHSIHLGVATLSPHLGRALQVHGDSAIALRGDILARSRRSAWH